jgi:hypothetical protein
LAELETVKTVDVADRVWGEADRASDAYKAAGEDLPLYFALGIGVAGPNGVLAHNNPNGESVLAGLRGIDHFEDSPIGAALFGAAEECSIPIDEE